MKVLMLVILSLTILTSLISCKTVDTYPSMDINVPERPILNQIPPIVQFEREEVKAVIDVYNSNTNKLTTYIFDLESAIKGYKLFINIITT